MLDTRHFILAAVFFVSAVASANYFIGIDRLHVIIRPDLNGDWFIQDDDYHTSVGIRSIEQTSEALTIKFARAYPQALTIQISTDDGLGPYVTAHANLGRREATIWLFAEGQVIDPRTIWDHLPSDRREQHNGNLWIDVTMSKLPRP